MSASCQKIDLPSWPRRDIFSFFSVLDQPFYSVCFRVDVTQLHTYTKTHGLSFYYVMTYLVTQAVNEVENLRYTIHDETVVLLSKGEIDSKKVRVEFSLEDMDMSGFQKGATYEQIKAYVLEHTGLKVSSLYISQIKRKCGLDVGQNYNLSKKEDAKVPKCPPEKEAAIRDALKYFQMI